ncbi:MAG: SAM-dependent methyltransferase, partial [Betaproteobacteria bacterium]
MPPAAIRGAKRRTHGDGASGTVLDLACGRGRHARYLAGLGHRVEAV